MNNVEKVMDLLGPKMNCSQSMLAVFGEAYGVEPAMAVRLGRALAGGMGHMAGTCGAISAAVIILGLAKDREDEAEARNASYSSVQELFKRFHAVHGTTDCRDLLGADMSTEEGMKRIQEENLVRTVCPAYVRSAADILEGLLNS